MDPIKVIIADDDEGIRMIEKKIFQKAGGFDIIAEAADGEELLTLVEKLRPRIVFLDVEMPAHTGIECARLIQDLDPGIILIFATAHDQYMKEAFEVYAFDYLVKPFRLERALQTLERVKTQLAARAGESLGVTISSAPRKVTADRLMLKHRDGVTFIDMNDILLVQREDRATVIYTVNDGRYVTPGGLSEIESRLDPDIFMRCHKSYIINLNEIADISPYGRWTYVVRLKGTKQDALITHDKFEQLESMFS